MIFETNGWLTCYFYPCQLHCHSIRPYACSISIRFILGCLIYFLALSTFDCPIFNIIMLHYCLLFLLAPARSLLAANRALSCCDKKITHTTTHTEGLDSAPAQPRCLALLSYVCIPPKQQAYGLVLWQ